MRVVENSHGISGSPLWDLATHSSSEPNVDQAFCQTCWPAEQDEVLE